MAKILREAEGRISRRVDVKQVLLIDDDEECYEEILGGIGAVRYLKPGRDYGDFYELLRRLDEVLDQKHRQARL